MNDPTFLTEIRPIIRKLLERELPHYRKERLGRFPRNLFKQCAEAGLAGIGVSEEFGGIDASAESSAGIMEELAIGDLGPAIFISVHAMVAKLIEKFGNQSQKEKYLSRMASGELLGAFALTEPSSGSDAASLRTTAELAGDDFVLTGEKSYISSADSADLFIVFASSNLSLGAKGISAFIVERVTAGVIVSPPDTKMGCELSTIASVTLSKAKVSRTSLLGAENEGFKIALSGLAGGRVNIAACAVGIAKAALRLAVNYAKERKQFQSRVIDFQGIQFMLADMKMKLDAAALLTKSAARGLDEKIQTSQSRIAPSIAKCFATDAAMEITTNAVQILGGAGYLEDYDVERIMRDAKMLQIVEGTNQIQRVLIARGLDQDTAGTLA